MLNIDDSWYIVHDCHVDELLGSFDHIDESIDVIGAVGGTEGRRGGLQILVGERAVYVDGKGACT